MKMTRRKKARAAAVELLGRRGAGEPQKPYEQ
jgi:hypothetical protein